MTHLNPRIHTLDCVECGASHVATAEAMTCPDCNGILDPVYDLEDVPRGAAYLECLADRSLSHWRYEELLPVLPPDATTALRVGFTPVYRAPRLATGIDLAAVWVKDDGLNPTSSFKDRASSVGVAMAQALERDVISCASTGNAASSLAGMAAAAGMAAVILVPARAPAPKVAQLRVFGAKVLRVDADYSTVWELCQTLIEKRGWYNRNCAVNPWLVEGKKTAGIEIGEQCRDADLDWVAVSVGDGCTIAGVAKGLEHMVALGVLPRLPRVLGVQAEGVATVYHAWRGEPMTPSGDTFADSISVVTPRNLTKAVRAVQRTDGAVVTVTDDAIRAAMTELPRATGVFAEPAAAATLAGLRAARAANLLTAKDRVLMIVTGNGLKDIASAQQVAGEASVVDANLTAIEAGLEALE